MSSVHHDSEEARVEDVSDNTSTAVSQGLAAVDGTSETPSPKSQELENHAVTDSTSEEPTSNSQELEKPIARNDDTSNDQTVKYPGPLPRLFLIIATCISVFLVALDRTIITTVSVW